MNKHAAKQTKGPEVKFIKKVAPAKAKPAQGAKAGTIKAIGPSCVPMGHE